MFKRPFTAICQTISGITEAVVVEVPNGERDALAASKEQLPNKHIVALIPGIHADHAYTFDAPGSYIRLPVPSNPAGDSSGPWPENLPPGF